MPFPCRRHFVEHRLAEPLEPRLLLSTVTVAAATVDEAAEAARFTATLDVPADRDVSVAYRTVNGSARAGRDFLATRGSVVIPAGETSASFDVKLVDGGGWEPEETFAVTLRAGPGATLAAKRMTATVVDDEPPPTVQVVFSERDGNVIEREPGESTFLSAELRLTHDSDYLIRVSYQTVDGTATAAGGDYRATRGVATFRPFNTLPTSQPAVKLFVLGDDAVESPESFSLEFESSVPAVTIDRASIEVDVFDDDHPVGVLPFLSASPSRPDNEDQPHGDDIYVPQFWFNVTMAAAPDGATLPQVPVTVEYATSDGGTATAGVDYVPASGVLTFAPGETTQRVDIYVIPDEEGEYDETIHLTLSNPVNGIIADGEATLTILNDDVDRNPEPPDYPPPDLVPPRITILPASVAEGDLTAAEPEPVAQTTTLMLEVTLSRPRPVRTVTVDYATGPGQGGQFGAVAGVDYAAVQGTLTFLPGETQKFIPVTIFGDIESELDEEFRVTLSNPVNGTPGTHAIVVTIVDDDAPPGGTGN